MARIPYRSKADLKPDDQVLLAREINLNRALVNSPAVVWADEPTGNLDSESAIDILSLIERLNRENGQTFVLVTHDGRVAERASRILRMRDGQIDSEEHTNNGPMRNGSIGAAPHVIEPASLPRPA